jgi:transposase
MTHERIEVITSVQRRRRWSRAEKEKLVAASLEPDASVSTLARGAGIQPSQLYGWRRQLLVGRQVSFAPARIAPEAASIEPPGAGMIAIEYTNGTRMRITGVVDPATLTAAIAALANGRRS